MNRILDLPEAGATDALGRALAATRPARAVVYLRGDLGAGKSTLARALLLALGAPGPIKSPTYTLVERHRFPGGEAAHLDLYRIASPGELEFLGLDEVEASASLWLVEWPERGGAALPAPDLEIQLRHDGGGRRASLVPLTGVGADWLARAAPMLALPGSS